MGIEYNLLIQLKSRFLNKCTLLINNKWDKFEKYILNALHVALKKYFILLMPIIVIKIIVIPQINE